MNGSMKLHLKHGFNYEVFGGPYTEKPTLMVGVKMAPEIRKPAMVYIDTPDFDVPPMEDMQRGIEKAVSYILDGSQVYFGCMAGRGRTGLALACLAKTFGMEDVAHTPAEDKVDSHVRYVRHTYYEHAVETPAQASYVSKFEPTELTLAMIKKAGRGLWWKKYFSRFVKDRTPEYLD